jgi:hypothetical protein
VTTEQIRETIKVHIQAAESCGKNEKAMALLELLVAVDAQLLEEGYFNARSDPERSSGPETGKNGIPARGADPEK